MLHHSVKEIYAGYQKIMETKRRGDVPLITQLHERFGLTGVSWGRLKVLYEAALAGRADAAELVARVDSGELSIFGAYNRLRKADQDTADAANLPKTVRLAELYPAVLRYAAYIQAIDTALRLGVPVNTTGMSAADIADCAQHLHIAARHSHRTAAHLGTIMNGDPS